MAQVFLGLGSNIDAPWHLTHGIERLSQCLRIQQMSPWYRSQAVGFDGPDFINLVLAVESNLSLEVLSQLLKQIELEFGRDPNAVKYSSRALDIDILLYDDWVGDYRNIQLPRADVYQCAYVLRPLLDLVPDFIDPKTQQPLANVWANVAQQSLIETAVPDRLCHWLPQ